MQEEVSHLANSLKCDIDIIGTEKNLIERAKILFCHAKRVPNKIHKNGLPNDGNLSEILASTRLMDYCRLVGFGEDLLTQKKSRPQYQQVYAWKEKFSKGTIEKLTRTTEQDAVQGRGLQYQIVAPKVLSEDDNAGMEICLASPSEVTRPSVSSLESDASPYTAKRTCNHTAAASLSSTISSITHTTTTGSATSSKCTTASKPSHSGSSTFSSIVNNNSHRNTSSQARTFRSDAEKWKRCHGVALEWATEFYAQAQKGSLPLFKFKESDAVASFINASFDCDVISSREIREAFARKLSGRPIIVNIGRSKEMPDDVLDDLASLLFTALTIDQNNCAPERLTRKLQTSIIGKTLSTKNGKKRGNLN